MIFYGNDGVIKKWVKFFQITKKTTEPSCILSSIIDVLIDIRKDMGYPETNLTAKDVLQILTNSPEEALDVLLKEMKQYS